MRRSVPFIAAVAVPLALALAACGGGTATSAPAATPATPTSAPATTAPPAEGSPAVTIEDFAFRPASITVRVGTTVSWANRDSAPHSVKWADGTPTSGNLTTGGESYERTFDTPGTFAYACGIHSSMMGSVTVEP